MALRPHCPVMCSLSFLLSLSGRLRVWVPNVECSQKKCLLNDNASPLYTCPHSFPHLDNRGFESLFPEACSSQRTACLCGQNVPMHQGCPGVSRGQQTNHFWKGNCFLKETQLQSSQKGKQWNGSWQSSVSLKSTWITQDLSLIFLYFLFHKRCWKYL